jgi:hypothetical protein
MPDRLSRPPSFEDSLLMVEDRMRRRMGGFERLDRQALRKYSARQPAAGWRLTVPTPDGERRLDVIVPLRFPFALPHVALVGPSKFLEWAHFEKDGVLCLAGGGFDVERPGAVVAASLPLAGSLPNASTGSATATSSTNFFPIGGKPRTTRACRFLVC